jgi:hypothetical protein
MMTTIRDRDDLMPESVRRLRQLDPEAAADIEHDVSRLVRAGQWTQEQAARWWAANLPELSGEWVVEQMAQGVGSDVTND